MAPKKRTSKPKPVALAPIPTGRPKSAIVKGAIVLPAVAAAVDQIETLFGTRGKLIQALAGAPLDEDLAFVLNCLADPRQDARKLSTICGKMGISLFDLYEVLKRGIFAAATIESMQIVAEQTPPVVKDVMARAVPHSVDCPDCNGVGTVGQKSKPDAAPVQCTTCKGTGKKLVIPDLARQQFALSLGPLAPKGSALIQNNVDARSITVGDHSAEGFAKLLAATDKVLHGRRAPLTISAVVDDDLTAE